MKEWDNSIFKQVLKVVLTVKKFPMVDKHEEIIIENLLSQVSLIVKKYDEIAAITGENIKIFS